MLLDIPEERSGDLDLRWGMPKDCRFPLFPFIRPLSFPKMGLVYFAMWLGEKIHINFHDKYFNLNLFCLFGTR